MLRIALAASMLLAGISLMYAADSSPRNARRGTACENGCNSRYWETVAYCKEKYGSSSAGKEGSLYDSCMNAAGRAWDICMEGCVE